MKLNKKQKKNMAYNLVKKFGFMYSVSKILDYYELSEKEKDIFNRLWIDGANKEFDIKSIPSRNNVPLLSNFAVYEIEVKAKEFSNLFIKKITITN